MLQYIPSTAEDKAIWRRFSIVTEANARKADRRDAFKAWRDRTVATRVGCPIADLLAADIRNATRAGILSDFHAVY